MIISDEQIKQIANSIVFEVHHYIQEHQEEYEQFLAEENSTSKSVNIKNLERNYDMDKKNPTEAIYQKIASPVNNAENKVLKTTPKSKQSNGTVCTSIYNNIMDTLKTETKGGTNNGQQQQQ